MQDSPTEPRGEDPEILFGHVAGQMGGVIVRGMIPISDVCNAHSLFPAFHLQMYPTDQSNTDLHQVNDEITAFFHSRLIVHSIWQSYRCLCTRWNTGTNRKSLSLKGFLLLRMHVTRILRGPPSMTFVCSFATVYFLWIKVKSDSYFSQCIFPQQLFFSMSRKTVLLHCVSRQEKTLAVIVVVVFVWIVPFDCLSTKFLFSSPGFTTSRQVANGFSCCSEN